MAQNDIIRFVVRPIHEEVGFDYVAALLRIRERLTYDEIAEVIGYDSKGGISRIMDGKTTPSHVRGEAIWALYVELFHERPPLRSSQNIRNNGQLVTT